MLETHQEHLGHFTRTEAGPYPPHTPDQWKGNLWERAQEWYLQNDSAIQGAAGWSTQASPDTSHLWLWSPWEPAVTRAQIWKGKGQRKQGIKGYQRR